MMEKYDLTSIFGQQNMEYFRGIDFETFISLQPEHVKEAIPNLVPRLKFEILFKKFLKTIAEDGLTGENESKNAVIQQNQIEVVSYNKCVDPLFDENLPSFNEFTTDSNLQVIADPESNFRKAVHIKTIQDIIDISNIELKVIITKYVNQQEPKPFENNDRVVIGKSIIHHLLVNDCERVITKPEFISLAELIVQLFPTELKGTYYTPGTKNFQAQGKLFSAYQNYKTQLREVGLVKKRAKAVNKTSYDEEYVVPLQERSEAIKFILEELTDFEQIKDCWQICMAERYRLLDECNIYEYIHKFPDFNLPNSYELLNLDARKLHSNKNSKLLEISEKILVYASTKKRTTLEARNLIEGYKESAVNLDEASLAILKQLTTIKLLPHFFPNPKKKYSKSEIANLFCPYFKTIAEAEIYNSKFKENYKDTTLVLKPRLYFIGDSLNPSVQLYICDKKYTILNAITGFETLFNCFLALKCQYPDETYHIWQFIKSDVYDIVSEYDKQSATVNTFIQDIRNIAD